jgi:hypothetical protein
MSLCTRSRRSNCVDPILCTVLRESCPCCGNCCLPSDVFRFLPLNTSIAAAPGEFECIPFP